MSSPADYYKSLPPVSKVFGTLCVLTTTAVQLGLLSPVSIALLHDRAFKHFEVWRLVTNFFFLGKFSVNFGIRLLMIARYGVQLEKGPFEKRTADFLWMLMVGSFSMLAFYLPWAMLALDVIFGSPLIPDFLGIFAGHLYYFFTVLNPLSGGGNLLKTPHWVHKIAARWGIAVQANTPAQPNRNGGAFTGRSYRLN